MNFFSDNENFERGPPRHAGGNGNQGINFVWPNRTVDTRVASRKQRLH